MNHESRKDHLLSIYKDFDIVFPKHTNKEFVKTANEINETNTFNVTSFGKVDFSNGINWNDERGRTFNRWFHSHFFMGDLISAYEKTENIIFLNKAYSLYAEWISLFEGKIGNKTAYHDETIAKRLTFWLRLYIAGYEKLEQEKLSKLEQSIVLTAELLSGDLFHDKNTNHGMFVDLSLLLFTYVFDNDGKYYPWRDKAITRLIEYFDFVYTSEGVHKEQTPAYHYTISLQLLRYSIAFKKYNKSFSLYLYEKYLITNTFGYQIIKPDGKIPQIGDNAALQVKDLVFKDLYEDPEFKYAISAGEIGTAPIQNDIVFKEAGYAIFRDSWNKKEKATYILFNAAYNSNYHKHSDDLSVLIYKDGDIFVEAGPNGYEYKDPYTVYGYSQFGHNSLVVDNQSLPRVDGKFDKVNISNYSIESEICEVEGRNGRYEDVVHQRKLKFNKKENHITIFDKIISKNKHEYSLFWNMAPNTSIDIVNDKYFINRDNSYIGEIMFSSDTTFHFNQSKGQTTPLIKGWHFPKMREKQQNYFVELSLTGNDVEFTTEIILYDEPVAVTSLNFTIDASIVDGKLYAKMVPEVINKDNLFAFYIRKDGQTIKKIMYNNQNEIEIDLNGEGGIYSLRCFLKNNGRVESKQSESFLNGEKKYKELNYFYEDNKSKYLVIIFSAMYPKNIFKYSYMNVLKNFNTANKLYILDKFGDQGCYYLGENRSGNVEKMVIELIEKITNVQELKKENIITVGSSKGGFAALYYSIKYNFGYSIVGAPQVLLGNYLLEETSQHLSIAEYIASGSDEEAKNYLNGILSSSISQSISKTNLFIHIGKGEPHYRNHFIPLINMLEQTTLNYKTDIRDYETHKQVAEHFPSYLQNTLLDITNPLLEADFEIRKSIKDKNLIIEVKDKQQRPNIQYSMISLNDLDVIAKNGYSNQTSFEIQDVNLFEDLTIIIFVKIGSQKISLIINNK